MAGPVVPSKTRRAGSALPPMPKRMHFDAWAGRGDGRADFQHVRPQDHLIARLQVVGVVLHKRCALPGSPVAIVFITRTRAAVFQSPSPANPKPSAHQPLHGQTGQLRQAVQVLERRREGTEAALRRETPAVPSSIRACSRTRSSAGPGLAQIWCKLVLLFIFLQQAISFGI